MEHHYVEYRDFRDHIIHGSYKGLINDNKYVTKYWDWLASISAAYGKTDIVMALRDSDVGGNLGVLAKELHIACAKGHLDTARLIYKISKDVYRDCINTCVKDAIYASVRTQREILYDFANEILAFHIDDINRIVQDMIYKGWVKGLEFMRSIGIDLSNEMYACLAISLGEFKAFSFFIEKCGTKITNKEYFESEKIFGSVIYFREYEMAFLLMTLGFSLDVYKGKYTDRLKDVKKYCEIRKRWEAKMERIRVNRVYFKFLELISVPWSKSASRLAEASYNATMRGEVL